MLLFIKDLMYSGFIQISDDSHTFQISHENSENPIFILNLREFFMATLMCDCRESA